VDVAIGPPRSQRHGRGGIQLTFMAGVVGSVLVGVARDKSGSRQSLEGKSKGVDLPVPNDQLVL
jgi:hypothetical protein